MKKTRLPLLLLLALNAIDADTTTVSTIIELGGTAMNAPAHRSRIDDTFLRGEATIQHRLDSEASAEVHMRIQVPFTQTPPVLQIQQAWFEMPVRELEVRLGRWYARYSPHRYFGRYLFDLPGPLGSGAMNTDYTQVDGLRLGLPLFNPLGIRFLLAFLAGNPLMKEGRVVLRVEGTPMEGLYLTLGANAHALSSTDREIHRFAAAGRYRFPSGLAISAELGVADLAVAAEQTWLAAGIDLPTRNILDLCRIELEYTAGRIEQTPRADLSWMFMIGKNLGSLRIDLAAGVDPQSLGSRDWDDIGAILRLIASF